MFLIGYITTTHGVKGEVKVKNLSDYDRFKVKQQVSIGNQMYTIEHVKTQHDRLIIKFKEINTMNEAQLLKDQDIFVDQKPTSQSGTHYQDIIGKEVYNKSQAYIGTVKYIREVPQGHILEIDVDGTLKLIPFVDAFIHEVLEDKIIIDVIEGLL